MNSTQNKGFVLNSLVSKAQLHLIAFIEADLSKTTKAKKGLITLSIVSFLNK